MGTQARVELGRLRAEERQAWDEYLDATRGKAGKSYADVEPWAWAKLTAIRKGIKRRRKKVLA